MPKRQRTGPSVPSEVPQEPRKQRRSRSSQQVLGSRRRNTGGSQNRKEPRRFPAVIKQLFIQEVLRPYETSNVHSANRNSGAIRGSDGAGKIPGHPGAP